MAGKRLVVFFLVILALELMLFPDADAWRRRRRRRRRVRLPRPPPCASSIPYPSIKWSNTWRQSFRAYCPDGYSLNWWISVYRKCQQDRIYHFRCRLGPVIYRSNTHCRWSTSYTNNYQCPNGGFITGVKSYFHARSRDRKFAFKCCNNGAVRYHCRYTWRWVNRLTHQVYYNVPIPYRLVGVRSRYSSSNFDRRWKFRICKFKITKSRE